MNKENMCKLIDHLDALDNGEFYMGAYSRYKYNKKVGDFCQTPSCIAGHAAFLCKGDLSDKWLGDSGLHELAAEWLELDPQTAEKLFTPREFAHEHYTSKVYPYRATPAQAALVVNHLLNTGEVDWSKMYGPADNAAPTKTGASK